MSMYLYHYPHIITEITWVFDQKKQQNQNRESFKDGVKYDFADIMKKLLQMEKERSSQVFSYKKRFLLKGVYCEHLIFLKNMNTCLRFARQFFQLLCKVVWYSKPEILVLIWDTIHFKYPINVSNI